MDKQLNKQTFKYTNKEMIISTNNRQANKHTNKLRTNNKHAIDTDTNQ